MDVKEKSKNIFIIHKNDESCLIIFDTDCKFNPRPSIIICRPRSFTQTPHKKEVVTPYLEKLNFVNIHSKKLRKFLLKHISFNKYLYHHHTDLIENIFIESSNLIWRYNLFKSDDGGKA